MTAKEDSLNRILHVIADPTRRRILESLKARSAQTKAKGLCASDIEGKIGLSQPTISHHMSVLENAGLIRSQKEGQWRWYRRNEPAIRDFAKSLKQSL